MKKMQCKKLFLCCGISMLALFGLYGCTSKNGTNTDGANTGNANTGTVNAGEAGTGNTGTANTTAGTTNNGTDGNATTGNATTGNTTNGNTTNGTTTTGHNGTGTADGNNSQTGNVEKSHQSEYAIGDVKNLEKFEIDHEAGNVIIGVSGDENINVKATANIKASTEEELNKIVENIDVVSKVVDNKCILRVVHKGENMELWDWLEKEQKEKNVSIDLEILLPKNFLSYVISTDEGNLHVAGLEGNMDLEADAGDIKVELVENLSKSTRMEIESDKGNVEINLKKNPVEYMKNEANHMKGKINKVCDLDVSTDNGNITVVE